MHVAVHSQSNGLPGAASANAGQRPASIGAARVIAPDSARLTAKFRVAGLAFTLRLLSYSDFGPA